MKKLLTVAALCAIKVIAMEIIVDHNAASAIKDLHYHWRKMTGDKAKLSIRQHPYKVKGSSFSKEGFRLKAVNNKVYISGESKTGVANGIYELLNMLGCDWVFPGEKGEVIPKIANPTLADCDVEEFPSFIIRNPWLSGSNRNPLNVKLRKEHSIWSARHKLNTREAHPLVMRGGHVWDVIIRKYKKQFEADKEMYALVRQLDGSMIRRGPQLETTNAKVLSLFEDYIRKEFARNKWPKDKAVCISVGPADGGGFSQSLETTLASANRIDPMSGNRDGTDIMILLCNQLLTKLEKEFPNLHLGFYLYSWHADYPVRYKIHPRIIIVIADISYSRMHSTLESTITRSYYRAILEKWNKAPNIKFFRGYNWNLAEHFLPYSKLKMWADDFPYYHKLNVQGIYNESTSMIATLAPSNYYEAKLLWNVKSDMNDTLKRFCRAAYGKGAEPMEKYYLAITKRQSEAREEAGSIHSFFLIYDEQFVAEHLKLFDQAEKLAELPIEKERIKIARFPLEQLGKFLKMRNLQNQFRFAEAEKILDQMLTERKAEIAKRDGTVGNAAVGMLDRFFNNPLKTAVKYSTGEYKMIYAIPDELITIFDPYNRGFDMGMAKPDLRDDKFLRTRTFTSTWASQGLIAVRTGSAWYRIHLPKIKEKTVGLCIGGGDNVVRVYCNGLYSGAGAGFAKPFLFDLTGQLKGDGTDVLAIQVERRGNSEVGTGGLIYPSFLFTGPRLEQPAPVFEETERILPGGVVEKIKKAAPAKKK